MSTITVARVGSEIAIAADSLTTFDETRLPPDNDAEPDKILAVETPDGTAYVGVVGFTAHHLVLKDAFSRLEAPDFSSRDAVFQTILDLHPMLKEDYYLLPESGEDGDPYESSQISVLIAAPSGLYGVYDMREVHAVRHTWAMGSGAPYALGAMDALRGADATLSAEALARAGVEAGCRFDRSSGAPVVSFVLRAKA